MDRTSPGRLIVKSSSWLKFAGNQFLQVVAAALIDCVLMFVYYGSELLKLMMAGNYSFAMDIAKQQVEDGAHVIDINVDDGTGMLDGLAPCGDAEVCEDCCYRYGLLSQRSRKVSFMSTVRPSVRTTQQSRGRVLRSPFLSLNNQPSGSSSFDLTGAQGGRHRK
jgi:hypothetical protein